MSIKVTVRIGFNIELSVDMLAVNAAFMKVPFKPVGSVAMTNAVKTRSGCVPGGTPIG